MMFGLAFVGARQAAVAGQPGECPLHHPPAGYVESDLSSVVLRLGSGYRLAGAALNLDNRLS
jgi:hypothetical protein